MALRITTKLIKEWNENLGLNMYEMDMRQNDPAIVRWISIDPITHYSASPYNSFDNNPIFFAGSSGHTLCAHKKMATTKML